MYMLYPALTWESLRSHNCVPTEQVANQENVLNLSTAEDLKP